MDIPIVFSCPCGSNEVATTEIYVDDATAAVKVRGVCIKCQEMFEGEFNPKGMIELYRSGGENNLKKLN